MMKLMVEVTKTYYFTCKRSLLLARAFFVFVFIFNCSSNYAQFTDSISVDLKQKPKFTVKLDARNSFIRNSYARVVGYKAELVFNNRTKFGLSYNRASITLEETSKPLSLTVGYFAPYFEYVFYQKKNWELSIPVMIGFGRSVAILNESIIRKPLVLYEPYMTAEYTFLKYFIVGAGVGYRLGIVNPSNYLTNFSAPIYIIKLEFDFALLYQSIFKHSFPEPFFHFKN